jgi:hypothetical protein
MCKKDRYNDIYNAYMQSHNNNDTTSALYEMICVLHENIMELESKIKKLTINNDGKENEKE